MTPRSGLGEEQNDVTPEKVVEVQERGIVSSLKFFRR